MQQRYHALTGGNAAIETNKSEQMIYDAGNDIGEIGIGLGSLGNQIKYLAEPATRVVIIIGQLKKLKWMSKHLIFL
jgi:hypothetical protein